MKKPVMFRSLYLSALVLLSICIAPKPAPLSAQVLMADFPVLRTTGARWLSIETEHFEIVYPDEMQLQAELSAEALEQTAALYSEELKLTGKSTFTVILDRAEFTPNGYVVILPRSSVFYSLPAIDQNIDWYTLLSVHEGRHIAQIKAANRGVTRLLNLAFGDQGLIPLFFAPDWIYEGDAVMAETLYTNGGRGRNPLFTMPVKGMILEDSMPSYQTMIHGSYTGPMPNAYTMGYLMYAHLRTAYTRDAPRLLAEGLGSLPLPLAGTALGMHRAAGISASDLYKESIETAASFWSSQAAILPSGSSVPFIPDDEEHRTEYSIQRELHYLKNGNMAVWQYSYARGNEILLLNRSGEELQRITASPHSAMSAGGGFIAWDQHRSDLKFSESSNRILLYSADTGETRAVTGWGRVLSPALNSSGKYLACINWSTDQRGTLTIMETENGTVLYEWPLPKGEFWQELDWSEDDKSIYYLATGSFGQYIGSIETESGRHISIEHGGEYVFRTPRSIPGGLLYTASYSGVPAVYRLMKTSNGWTEGEPELLYHGLSGSWSAELSPDPDKRGIVFIDYTGRKGSSIRYASLENSGIPLNEVPVVKEEFYRPLLDPQAQPVAEQSPMPQYNPKEYYFGLNGLKLHSWTLLPRSADVLDEPSVGLTLRADSVAHTWAHEADFLWNVNEETFSTAYTLTYRALRPDISLGTVLENRRTGTEEWTELFGNASISLPLGKSYGTHSWSFEPGVEISATTELDEQNDNPETAAALTLNTGITGPSSMQSLQSRWGLLSENYYNPDGHLYSGAALLLPGITFPQGLRFTGFYEENSLEESSYVPFPRGWAYEKLERLWSARSDYRLPLGYPDISLGNFATLKRVRGKLYGDMLGDMDSGDLYRSAGGEINFDFHLLQLPVELSAGIRLFYQVETEKAGFQFLLLGGGI